MTWADWVWVSVRIIGVYLLVLPIVALRDAISALCTGHAYSHLALTPQASRDPERGSAACAELLGVQAAFGIRSCLRVLLYAVFGYCLIRGGAVFHRLIARRTMIAPIDVITSPPLWTQPPAGRPCSMARAGPSGT